MNGGLGEVFFFVFMKKSLFSLLERRPSGHISRQRCILMTNFNYDTFHMTVNYADLICQKLIYFIKQISDHLLQTHNFSFFQDGKSI